MVPFSVKGIRKGCLFPVNFFLTTSSPPRGSDLCRQYTVQLHCEIMSWIFETRIGLASLDRKGISKCEHISLSILTLKVGSFPSLTRVHKLYTSYIIGWARPIFPCTASAVSLKPCSSKSHAYSSNKSSSSSSSLSVSSRLHSVCASGFPF